MGDKKPRSINVLLRSPGAFPSWGTLSAPAPKTWLSLPTSREPAASGMEGQGQPDYLQFNGRDAAQRRTYDQSEICVADGLMNECDRRTADHSHRPICAAAQLKNELGIAGHARHPSEAPAASAPSSSQGQCPHSATGSPTPAANCNEPRETYISS